MDTTKMQFDEVIALCRDLFQKKLKDYGPAWRILRPESVTDQILIKVKRVRSIEIKKENLVGDSIFTEYIGIVNYGAIALIQTELGYTDTIDIDCEKALELYDKKIDASRSLMYNKNHDYDEAWRSMRTTSYTDLILMKIHRTKEIESNSGNTLVSEGVDANYMDMINYALFGLIKMNFNLS